MLPQALPIPNSLTKIRWFPLRFINIQQFQTKLDILHILQRKISLIPLDIQIRMRMVSNATGITNWIFTLLLSLENHQSCTHKSVFMYTTRWIYFRSMKINNKFGIHGINDLDFFQCNFQFLGFFFHSLSSSSPIHAYLSSCLFLDFLLF